MYVVTNVCKKKMVLKLFKCFFSCKPILRFVSMRLASAYTNALSCKKSKKATQFRFFSEVDSKDWVQKKCGLAFLYLLIESPVII